MKTVFLDAEFANREAVFAHLAEHLEFPAHFGRNLDALWDVLRGDVGGPFEIVWRDPARAQAALGADYDQLVALLEQLAEERADFTFRVA